MFKVLWYENVCIESIYLTGACIRRKVVVYSYISIIRIFGQLLYPIWRPLFTPCMHVAWVSAQNTNTYFNYVPHYSRFIMLGKTILIKIVFWQVFADDDMPCTICDLCRSLMEYWYQFKQMCKTADTKLKQYPLTGALPEKLEHPPYPDAILKVYISHKYLSS